MSNPETRRRLRHWGAALLAVAVTAPALLVWRAPEVAAWAWRLRAGRPEMTDGKVTLAGNLRWVDDYYVVEDLGHRAFAIGEPLYGQCNFSYLIAGSRRALLFDSGPGLRNILPVIRALTSVPVMALPSHLHFDHIGNLNRFDEVALPDLPALRQQQRDGVFRLGFYQYLGFVEGFRRPEFRATQWIQPGSDIDLGDRRLTLLSAPGHTPESVVLLDRAANRLFAGDFIYPLDIYAFLPGADLRDYSASAGRVAQLLNNESTVYAGHGCDRLPTVDVPMLNKSDVLALGRALALADSRGFGAGTGWYPRELAVNERMRLLAKYPWMRP